MKDAPAPSRLPFLRSIVADARPSLMPTSEPAPSSAVESAGLDLPAYRHDPLRAAQGLDVARAGAERRIGVGVSSEPDRDAVSAPTTVAPGRPPEFASTRTAVAEVGVQPMLSPGEPHADPVFASEAAMADRPSTSVSVRPFGVDVGAPQASATDVAPAAIVEGRTREEGSRPTFRDRTGEPVSEIVQTVARDSLSAPRITPVEHRASGREDQPWPPQRRSPELRRVSAPGAVYSGREGTKPAHTILHPETPGGESGKASTLTARLEDARSEPASPINPLETQPERHPAWREMALSAARATLRTPSSDAGRGRGEAARTPDVQIGHVDITVVSSDPVPSKSSPPPAVSPAASLASLHYLRRF